MRIRGDERERDLVESIRAELAAIEPTRSCCRAAERAGLGEAATGRARTPVVARLAVRLEPPTGSRAASGTEPMRAVAPATPGAPPGGAVVAPETAADSDWGSARDHCRVAWLRGRFLARGSLSLGLGRTHLEFVVDPAEGPVLIERLASMGLPASWRVRRGRGVVTWKGAEPVMTFLRRAGASSSVLELEARLVARQLRGDLNRALNAETSNLRRSVAASARQVDAIETLEREGRLGAMPELERSVARLRLQQPEATLGELADQLGLSRARVQRALERLGSAATHGAGIANVG